mmetsp:Transcript_22056/g.68678  ORF Transcript_22056/g.68678 Transcript_22056/m.68678 type:complete len:304 (-) Transcript_22056:10-921(-)
MLRAGEELADDLPAAVKLEQVERIREGQVAGVARLLDHSSRRLAVDRRRHELAPVGQAARPEGLALGRELCHVLVEGLRRAEQKVLAHVAVHDGLLVEGAPEHCLVRRPGALDVPVHDPPHCRNVLELSRPLRHGEELADDLPLAVGLDQVVDVHHLLRLHGLLHRCGRDVAVDADGQHLAEAPRHALRLQGLALGGLLRKVVIVRLRLQEQSPLANAAIEGGVLVVGGLEQRSIRGPDSLRVGVQQLPHGGHLVQLGGLAAGPERCRGGRQDLFTEASSPEGRRESGLHGGQEALGKSIWRA